VNTADVNFAKSDQYVDDLLRQVRTWARAPSTTCPGIADVARIQICMRRPGPSGRAPGAHGLRGDRGWPDGLTSAHREPCSPRVTKSHVYRAVSEVRASSPFASTTRPCGTRGLEAALQRAASRPVRLTLTETAPCSCPSAARGPRGCGCTACPARRRRRGARGARGLRRRTSRSADGDVRRFMNGTCTRAAGARTLPPLVTRGQVHDLQHVYERAQHPLLRLRPARA